MTPTSLSAFRRSAGTTRWSYLGCLLAVLCSILLPAGPGFSSPGVTYTYLEGSDPGGPEFEWVSDTEFDALGAGEPVLLSGGYSEAFDIGFEFDFYGRKYSHVYLNERGFLIFQAPQWWFLTSIGCSTFTYRALECFEFSKTYGMTCLERPTTEMIVAGGAISYSQGNNGRIRMATRGEPGDREFIVEFAIVTEGVPPELTADTQIILSEATGDIRIQFLNVSNPEGERFYVGVRDDFARSHVLSSGCGVVEGPDVLTPVADTYVARFTRGEMPSLRSDTDRVYFDVSGPQPMEPLTIEQRPGRARIKAGQPLRLSFPRVAKLRWDTSEDEPVLGGTAASKVLPFVTFENGNDTLLLEVLEDFEDGETLTLSGLFVNHSYKSGFDTPGILFMEGANWGVVDVNHSLTGPVASYIFRDNISGYEGPDHDWVDMTGATEGDMEVASTFDIGFDFEFFDHPYQRIEFDPRFVYSSAFHLLSDDPPPPAGFVPGRCSAGGTGIAWGVRNRVIREETGYRYLTRGEPGGREFVVEMTDIYRSVMDELEWEVLGEARSHDMQMILREETGEVLFHFRNVEDGRANRIGMQLVDEVRATVLTYISCDAAAIDEGLRVAFAPVPLPTVSSEADQIFYVRDDPQPMSPLTITDTSGQASIKAGAELAISIPQSFQMTWDTSVAEATLAGSAAQRVSSSAVYRPGNKTVAFLVESDFDPGESIVISGLRFTSFNNTSQPDSLQVAFGTAFLAYDDKTKSVIMPETPVRMTSAENQTLLRAGGQQTSVPITISSSYPSSLLRAGTQISIQVIGVASPHLRFAQTRTTYTYGGPAAGKVDPTVTHIGGTSVRLTILEDLLPGEYFTIEDLLFDNPILEIPPTYLQLNHPLGNTLDTAWRQVGRLGEYSAAGNILITSCEHGEPIYATIPVWGPTPTASAKVIILTSQGERTENQRYDVFLNDTFLGRSPLGASSRAYAEFILPDISIVKPGDNLLELRPREESICITLWGAGIVVDGGSAPLPQITSVFPNPAEVASGSRATGVGSAFFPFFRPSVWFTVSIRTPEGRYITGVSSMLSNVQFNRDINYNMAIPRNPVIPPGEYLLEVTLQPSNTSGFVDAVATVPITITDGPYFDQFGNFFTPNRIENDGFVSTRLQVTVFDSSNDVVSVRADLSSIGGSEAQKLYDDGTNMDPNGGDNRYNFGPITTIATEGTYPITITALDAMGQMATLTLNLIVDLGRTPRVRLARFVPPAIANNGEFATLLEAEVFDRDGPEDVVSVIADLSSIGGASEVHLNDSGENGDLEAGDGYHSFGPITTIVAPGLYQIPITARDTTNRSHTNHAILNVAANTLPVADAGGNQSVAEESLVTLDGSASYHPDDTPISFRWEQTAGRPIALADPDSAVTTFAAPNLLSTETVSFTLTVSTGIGLSDSDTAMIEIIADNDPPIFVEGPSATPSLLNVGDLSTLAVSASPPDLDDTVSVTWSILAGEGELLSTTGPVVTFTAPQEIVDPSTTTIRCLLTDSLGVTASADIEILLRPLPDLLLTPQAMLAEARIGQRLDIPFEVENIGPGPAVGEWLDCVYLSTDEEIGEDSPLHCLPRPLPLESGEHYERIFSFNVPNVPEGDYWFILKADALGDVKEEDEENNVTILGPVSVLLTPCPDLIVPSVTGPSEGIRAGGAMQVDWIVENIGTGATNADYWLDHVYLSGDTNPTGQVKIALQTQINPSALMSGQSYSSSRIVTIPDNLSGSYFIEVRADSTNRMPECDVQNNSGFSAVPVEILPFSPPRIVPIDLEVAPRNPFRTETVTVSWQLNNAGFLPTGPARISHRISTRRIGNTTWRTLVDGVEEVTLNLAPGASTEQLSATVEIPLFVWGETEIRVLPVKIEGGTITLNGAATEINVQTGVPPDLVVTAVSHPTTVFSGQPASIGWTVRNDSVQPTLSTFWQDAVFLARDPVFDLDGELILLGIYPHVGELLSDEAYSPVHQIPLPPDADGDYYVIVYTDYLEEVFEGPFVGNNWRAGSQPISINYAPPDLVAENVRLRTLEDEDPPTPILSGSTLMVEYGIRNAGTGRAAGSIRNAIDLLDGGNAHPPQSLGSFNSQISLQPGETGTFTRTVTIPFPFASLDAAVQVRANMEESLFESDYSNNAAQTEDFTVEHNKPDLFASWFVATQGAPPGKQLNLSWSLVNLGGPMPESSWQDRVYLSAEAPFSPATSHLLGIFPRIAALGTNESLASGTIPAAVPDELTGSYRTYLQVDALNEIDELNESNNVRPGPVVRVGDFCDSDIAVVNVSPPQDAVTGQSFTVQWTVRNTGTASTSINSWSDQVFLSRDQFLDFGSDVRLARVGRQGGLDPGEEYTRTASVRIPAGLTGPWYVFVYTDVDASLCEVTKANNRGHEPVAMNVMLLPETDLVATAITHPAEGVIGEQAAFTWTVENTLVETFGNWVDALYLSEDATWDAADVRVAEVPRSFPPSSPLEVGQSYTATLAAALPGITPGEYHAIARVDPRNVVVETDIGNNDITSVGTVNVRAVQLELGVPREDPLTVGAVRYYALEVEEGQTLAIDLGSNRNDSVNELYVRFEEIPTRSLFDFRGLRTLEPEQTVVVPRTKQGTYFIMARNDVTLSGPQTISLMAEYRPFGAEGVTPRTGGNSGRITVRLDGSRLDPFTGVVLSPVGNPGGVFAGIQSEEVSFISPSVIRATFDLTGIEPGLMDVWVVSDQPLIDYDPDTEELYQTSVLVGLDVLQGAFEVVEGGGPLVEGRVFAPGAAQFGAVYQVVIDVFNSGTNDAEVPVVEVLSATGTGLSAERAVQPGDPSAIQFLLRGELHPHGVMPPEERINFPIFAAAGTFPATRIELRFVDNLGDPVDWDQLEPDYADDTPEWPDVWEEFRYRMGNTVGDFHQHLRRVGLARMAAEGIQAIDVALVVEDLIEEVREDLFGEPPSSPPGNGGKMAAAVNWAAIQDVDPALIPPHEFGSKTDPGCGDCVTGPISLEAFRAAFAAGAFTVGQALGGFPGECLNHFLFGDGSPLVFDVGNPVVGRPPSLQAAIDMQNAILDDPDVRSWIDTAEALAKVAVKRFQMAEGMTCGQVRTIPIEQIDAMPGMNLGLEQTFNLGIHSIPLGITLGRVPGQGLPKPRISGYVELRKKCKPSGCCSRVVFEFFPEITMQDIYDFCPGGGRGQGRLSDFVLYMIQQLESCGVGQEFLVDIIMRPRRSTSSLECDKTGADWNDSLASSPCQRSRRPPATPRGGAPASAANVQTIASADPNEIVGPPGYGPEQWIGDRQDLPYTIYFENMDDATAPAQVVRIVNPLDPGMDVRRFALGDVGFDDVVIPVPPNRFFYSTTEDFTTERGFLLRVTGQIDIVERVATWTLETLDPATGEQPANPLLGFLPPNIESPEGEGFVSYVIRAVPELPSGTVIENSASIFFDNNDPIDTNVHLNTVDSVPPSSSVAVRSAPTGGLMILSWEAGDSAPGSGVRQVNILMSTDGGAYTLLGRFTPEESPLVLPRQPGVRYRFSAYAEDNAGNTEPVPQAAQTSLFPSILQVTPDRLNFPSRDVEDGPSDPFAVLLTNAGDDAVDIISVALAPPLPGRTQAFAFQVPPGLDPLEPGESRSFSVIFDPVEPGLYSSGILIETNDSLTPQVTVPLFGVGLPYPSDYWLIE